MKEEMEVKYTDIKTVLGSTRGLGASSVVPGWTVVDMRPDFDVTALNDPHLSVGSEAKDVDQITI